MGEGVERGGSCGHACSRRSARCAVARSTALLRCLVRALPRGDHAAVGSCLSRERVTMGNGARATFSCPLTGNSLLIIHGVNRGTRGPGRGVGFVCRSSCVVMVRGGGKLLAVSANGRGRRATCSVLVRRIHRHGPGGHMFVMRHLSHSASKLLLFTGGRRVRRVLRAG